MTDWHVLSPDQALESLGANREGLSSAEATARLARHGPNRLPPPAVRSAWRRLLAQFDNVLIYALLASATVTLILGHPIDSAVILGVVLLNAVIGFIQEGRAESALDAIRDMLQPTASVLRDGRRQALDAADLVPGDIVLLDAGDRVPADLRLIRTRNLRIEEAALTGESVPVDKHTQPVAAPAPLGDRTCMAYSGTLVVAGQATGLVVETGPATELGRIGTLLSQVETLRTPLLRQMDEFGKTLTAVILATAAAVLLFAVLVHGTPWADAFLAAVGLAVAAIPEGLPAVLTITLAIGVERMAQRSAIIRRLPAVETLGAVSVICSDKTGTLTCNEMMVRSAVVAGGTYGVTGEGYVPVGDITRLDGTTPPGTTPPGATPPGATPPGADPSGAGLSADEHAHLRALAESALLCNDAALRRTDGGYTIVGDPMEGALLVFAAKAGAQAEILSRTRPRGDEIPFDAAHRFMATLHRDPDGGPAMMYVKGAPERVLGMCGAALTADGGGALDHRAWEQAVQALTAQGQRVLALAMRRLPADHGALTFADVEHAGDGMDGLVLLGLVGLIDPPRAEAIEAIEDCTAAGIRVKMITGDHAGTAQAIARQLGLRNVDEALTGTDLDRMDVGALRAAAARVDVFARTTPEHKLKLVEALQTDGSIIAMTGDGVNDAPALKRADVGIAMGKRGTEAAKEAGAMVLADDNFASIAAAVREGRTVYANIVKVIAWTLPTSAGEALAIIAAMLTGTELPITPVQILWVNMITAVALGLTLAFEPAEGDAMRHPPRRIGAPLLSPFLVWRVVLVAALMAAGCFVLFDRTLDDGRSVEDARTMVVNLLVVLEIFYLFSIRYLHGTSLTFEGLVGTKAVLIGVGAVVVLQLLYTYVPVFHTLFASAPLSLADMGLLLALGVGLLLLMEAEKLARRAIGWRGD